MNAITRFTKPISTALVVVVAALVVFLGVRALNNHSVKHLTAYFPRTVGIYKGSQVDVLGVQVGQITHITPEGTRVRVDLVYKSSQRLPANVGAALVPPSIVSDRYLQLFPVYVGGAVAPDHAVLQEDKTQVPVELDQIFGSLNQLNTALGPQGANSSGALSRLIDVGAANLGGNGAMLNSTLKGFSQAISALSDSRDALFGTVTQLQKFTTTLAQDDGGVRRVNADLTAVAGQLAGERTDLGAALANLATALAQVNTFVSTNRDNLTHDVAALRTVTSGLVGEQQAIKEIIDEAPLALNNLSQSFDLNVDNGLGALRNRTSLDPATLSCQIVRGLVGSVPALGSTIAGQVGCPSAPSGGTPGVPDPNGGLGTLLGGTGLGQALGNTLGAGQ